MPWNGEKFFNRLDQQGGSARVTGPTNRRVTVESIEEREKRLQREEDKQLREILAKNKKNDVPAVTKAALTPAKENTIEKKSILEDDARIDKLHEDAKRLIEKAQTKPNDYKDVFPGDERYDDTAIAKDEERIEEKKRKIKEEQTPEELRDKKVATIIEALFIDLVTRENLLGDRVEIYPGSEDAELFQGVDGLLYFRDASVRSPKAIAIDLTYSQSPATIEKKISTVVKNMSEKGKDGEGHIPHIKYHIGTDDKPTKMFTAPSVIVMVPKDLAAELLEAWEAKDHNRLRKSKLGELCVREIERQLSRFQSFGADIGSPRMETAYKEAHELFEQEVIAQVPAFKMTFADKEESWCMRLINRKLREVTYEALKNFRKS